MLFPNAGEEKRFVFFNEYKFIFFFIYLQLFHVLIFLTLALSNAYFESCSCCVNSKGKNNI